MKRKSLATLTVVILTVFLSSAVRANSFDEPDTDTRFVDAKVVEVNERHISVIARSGVEHVIAVDRADTKVSLNGRQVRLSDLAVGDIVTVELDAESPLKLARNIAVEAQANGSVAGLRP